MGIIACLIIEQSHNLPTAPSEQPSRTPHRSFPSSPSIRPCTTSPSTDRRFPWCAAIANCLLQTLPPIVSRATLTSRRQSPVPSYHIIPSLSSCTTSRSCSLQALTASASTTSPRAVDRRLAVTRRDDIAITPTQKNRIYARVSQTLPFAIGRQVKEQLLRPPPSVNWTTRPIARSAHLAVTRRAIPKLPRQTPWRPDTPSPGLREDPKRISRAYARWK